jgi:hypothetical protein
MPNYFSLDQFKSWANISETTYDSFLQNYLQNASGKIDSTTRQQFSLTSNTTGKPLYGSGNGIKTVPTKGAWQESGLTVTYSQFGNSSSLTLVQDQDYIVDYPTGLSSPVTRIILYTYVLDRYSSIQLSGTKGWSATVPSDLLIPIYYCTLLAYTGNKYRGQGMILENNIDDVKIKFQIPQQYLDAIGFIQAGVLDAVEPFMAACMPYLTEAIGIMFAI